MAATKDSVNTNERLFAVDSPSLRLAEGALLGRFTLGVDRLGAYSFLAGAESFGIIHIIVGTDIRTLVVSELIVTAATTDQSDGTTLASQEDSIFEASLLLSEPSLVSVSESRIFEGYIELIEDATVLGDEITSASGTVVLAITENLGSLEVISVLTNDLDTFLEPYFIDATEDFEVFAIPSTWFDSNTVTSAEAYTNAGSVVGDDTQAIQSSEQLSALSVVTLNENTNLALYEELDLFTSHELVDDITVLDAVTFDIEADTSTNDDATVLSDELVLDVFGHVVSNEIAPVLSTEIVVRIKTDIAYVSLQEIGGISRTIVSIAEIAALRTAPDNDIAISPVAIHEGPVATREDIDTNTSIIRTSPPQPSVARVGTNLEPTIYQTKSGETVAVTRTADEAPYALIRTFKGEI